MNKHNKFRKFINDIHLWLGLGAGIILFIVCLSGTIYTFRGEIEYCIHSDKYNASAYQQGKKVLPVETLITNLEQLEKGKVVSVFIPENTAKNYKLSLSKKGNKENKSRPTNYYIDPYSGQLMGTDKGKTSDFFMFVMKLHRWLLFDSEIGRPIVGIATIIFVILSVSGLILWFPKKLKNWKRWGHWKPGFKVNYKSNWKRINHDLHNSLGFYSLFILLIMALTGLCWSFEWYRNGISNIMGSEVFAGRREKPSVIAPTNGGLIPFSKITEISNKTFHYSGDITIRLPKDSISALVVKKNKTGFFALSASDKLELHPETGKIISIDKFENKPLNVQIVSLIKPLHLGEIYGTFSKIIYFICCLIGTSLPVTGTFIWLNKMKKNKK